MNREILNFIGNKFGSVPSEKYYTEHIDVWDAWWRGYYEPFHRYRFNNGLRVVSRRLFTLSMAKKVCEDWASILLNEKTKAVIADEKANVFIQGENETGGVFGDNAFWINANRLVEKAFYSGTGAVTIRLENAENRNGRLSASEKTKIKFSYIPAGNIIPISVHSGVITEAAFCSDHVVRGIKYTLAEAHVIEDGNYVIQNFWFRTNNGTFSPEPLPAGVAERINTHSPLPWFAILTPNIENNILDSNGLGVSVYHGATDVLAGIDIAYNNFVKDFELGQKKVFMEKSIVEELSDGTKVAPDDVGQQLFQYINGDLGGMGENKNPFIYEFNPTIRVDENFNGVQGGLDLLSFRCGLGNKHYQFNAGTVVTATQYTGDKQDLIQNAHKHYINVENFLLSLIRSVIRIGNVFLNVGADEDTDINIIFDDSVIIDKDAERLTDIQDVRDGIMAKWEYRVKWYGDTEEDAKKIISEIQNTEDIGIGFEDGEA